MQRFIAWANAHRDYWLDCVRIYLGLGLFARGLLLITNTLVHGMSNARSEATNTHLRTLTTRAYGFHTPEALICMAMLTRGGLCPPPPGRSHP